MVSSDSFEVHFRLDCFLLARCNEKTPSAVFRVRTHVSQATEEASWRPRAQGGPRSSRSRACDCLHLFCPSTKLGLPCSMLRRRAALPMTNAGAGSALAACNTLASRQAANLFL